MGDNQEILFCANVKERAPTVGENLDNAYSVNIVVLLYVQCSSQWEALCEVYVHNWYSNQNIDDVFI